MKSYQFKSLIKRCNHFCIFMKTINIIAG